MSDTARPSPTSDRTIDVRSLDLDRPATEATLDDNARIVCQKRYAWKDEQGDPIETPEDVYWRVASTLAAQELHYGASREQTQEIAEQFYEMMARRIWFPNSPTLSNAGREMGLSACFVLPVEDAFINDADGVMDTLKHMARIQKAGGGTGFAWSRLRPRGARIESTGGTATGPVSFMELYDFLADLVSQGGVRKGANMGVLRVDHPDIREFITCKGEEGRVENFNISVGVTDEFMEAVESDEPFGLRDPRDGRVVETVPARELFEQIAHYAWRNGEPGMLFLDEANRTNPVPHLFDYEGSNPCGEQFLGPWDVCNLGSLNVSQFYREDVPEDRSWEERIDWESMERYTRLSTRFLDNVIDANHYVLPEIEERAKNIRRIGNGIMGWADLLVRLGVPYSSEQAREIGRTLMARFEEWNLQASEQLAEQRGPFPEWEESVWGPDETCARDAEGNRIKPERRIRHCNVNTVAPTGTISIMAGCSGGIEPLYAVAFMRNQAGELMPDVNDDFVARAKQEGWYSEELMERIAEEGSIEFPEVPKEVKQVFETAGEIAPEDHVRMQAAFQEHVQNAISKTINLPEDASEEDVHRVYRLAYELNLKGITVYRDGSRSDQVLSTGATEHESVEAAEEEIDELEARVAELEEKLEAERTEKEEFRQELHRLRHHETRSRPDVLSGKTYEKDSPLGTLYVTINEAEDDDAFEVFVQLGKAGGSAMADAEAIGRLISLALRSGLSLGQIHKQLRGISSEAAMGFGDNRVLSMPDAIAQAIEDHLQRREGIQSELDLGEEATPAADHPSGNEANGNGPTPRLTGACPDCGSELQYMEGCKTCLVCGYSECS